MVVVVFPGGEDVSPSLYFDPQEWHCRSMQMLSVVSGATVVQDIGTWFAGQGIEYGNEHKQRAEDPDNLGLPNAA